MTGGFAFLAAIACCTMNQDAELGPFSSITRKYFYKRSMMNIPSVGSFFQRTYSERSDETPEVSPDGERMLETLQRGFDGLSQKIDREFEKRVSLVPLEEREVFFQICQREKAQLASGSLEISNYLRTHFWELLRMAEESFCHTALVPKAASGLSYTLRCSVLPPDPPPAHGKMICYISFGELGSGGEAKVKEVIEVSSKGFEQFAFRRSFNEEGRQEGAHVRLISVLTQRGVPRLVRSIVWKFCGKDKKIKQGILMPSYLPYSDVAKKGLVRTDEKIRIMSLLGETLSRLHQAGIVHLDVKWENIFLDDQDVPFLGNFGYASRIGEEVRCRGSLGWIAPELLWMMGRGSRAAGPKMDLWSFGVLLFSSFIRESPFEESQSEAAGPEWPRRCPISAGSFYRLCEGIEAERQKLLQGGYSHKVSRELGVVIAKLLATCPADRMSDDDILIGALQRLPEFVVKNLLPLASEERVEK